jgi:hypothetical protein
MDIVIPKLSGSGFKVPGLETPKQLILQLFYLHCDYKAAPPKGVCGLFVVDYRLIVLK